MSSIRSSGIQSIDRALRILEVLSNYKDGLGVTDLGNIVGLHKSTTFRILSSLADNGFVKKDTVTEKYKLSYKILNLASNTLDSIDIRDIAKPYIEELAHSTQETIHLAVLDNDVAIYIDKVESPRMNSIRMYSSVGRKVPLHCTGVGKVLISNLEFKEIKKILKEEEMIGYTDNTITNYEDLMKELKTIKENGYGFDEIEHEEDIRCVAAPIFDIGGDIVAVISIAGLTKYLTKERIPEVLKELLNATKSISKELGYRRKKY